MTRQMLVLMAFLVGAVGSIGAQAAEMAQPSFEVATIRRADAGSGANAMWSRPGAGRFNASGVSLAFLIQMAYGVNVSQIMGQPDWIETELYDVQAIPEGGVGLSREELKPRLQHLLAQRFHLEAHRETRTEKGFALMVARGGPKLTVAKGDQPPGTRRNMQRGQMHGSNWTMAFLASMLSVPAGWPVVDRTGLTGSYDIDLVYAADPDADTVEPSLATAVNESLGLRLDATKVPVEVVMIDHVDRVPTQN